MVEALAHARQEAVMDAATAPTDTEFLQALLDTLADQTPPQARGEIEAAKAMPDNGAEVLEDTAGSSQADSVAALTARIERVIARAVEALGDPVRARRWLVSPNRSLGGNVPVALLGSDEGADAVNVVLGRIEHGVFG